MTAGVSLNPWLPPAPVDFRRLCKDAELAQGPRGDRLRSLACHDLGANHLHRLGISVAQALASKTESPLEPVTLGIVSNATTDLVSPALAGAAARYGLALNVVAAPFGMTLQAALSPQSELLQARPQIVLLALDHRAYLPDLALSTQAQLDAAIGHVTQLVSAFKSWNANLIVQTIVAPPERLFGSFDRRQSGTPSWFAACFNQRLVDEVVGPGVALLDVEALAASLGTAEWFDMGQWFIAKLPFAQRFVPQYAESVARVLAAIRGKSRKVLVLDLDNTLWGGVVGDDGIEGLKLGQGDPVGEAFIEFQRAALALKNRGVLLTVCSKNDESVALHAIREHPDMILRETDFSAFQINWSDKASNLETLAKRLSLGLDSFVFFDDNPFEREQVRRALPSVCVPELPSDPNFYARILLTSGFFESISFSREDQERSNQYAANARRETLLTQSRDLDSYLRSLQMRAIFTAAGPVGWQRFAQLINKSNQFNLTTRRYTEADILALAADADTLMLQVRLLDCFGDNGMISSIICRRDGQDWLFDTWVMSCRVLGRRVEEAILNEVVARARGAGVERLCGVYRPTQRNGMVKDHYARLGFLPDGEEETGTRWLLNIADYIHRDVPIVAERIG